MRDPAGSIRFEPDRVVRDLKAPLPQDHFLRSALARAWVERGDLVPFEIADERTIVARRLPFVSQPSEWSDPQLHAAAALTLRLQDEAVQAGYDMKDASAWNVLFVGCRPVFCDLLSFEPLTDRRWWALGQFARHFLLPLLVSRRRGLKAHAAHAVWRDGMPVGQARALLGWTIFLTRHGMLLLGGQQGSHSDTRDVLPAWPGTGRRDPVEDTRRFRSGVHASMAWMLAGVAPVQSRDEAKGWAGYRQDRSHYQGASLELKRATVARWLERLSPNWVLDLGCNTGEFSVLAARGGARVVSADADHDSVAAAFAACEGHESIHPIVCALDDVRGGRGWAGSEFTGLMPRLEGRIDLVLMLALIHHLAVGAAVPLADIARFAAVVTKDALIVELIDTDDEQLHSLCRQRRRDVAEFGAEHQRRAFLEAGFTLIEEVALDGANRSLALFRKMQP